MKTTFVILLLAVLTTLSHFTSFAQEIEPNEDFQTATPTALNGDIEGSIGFRRDNDMYKVSIQEPGVLSMRVLNVPSAINVSIFLYNSDQGDEIRGVYTREFGTAIGTELSICEPGDYFILIRDFSFNGGPDTDFDSTSLYTLRTSFESFPPSDNCDCSNETFRDACAIALDTTFVATLAPPFNWPFQTGFTSINTERDIDFYELVVDEPGALEFNIIRPSDGIIKFAIFNSNQDLIYDDELSYLFGSRFGISICDPGTFYVRIIDATPSAWDFSASNKYTFSVSFTPFRSINDCDCENQNLNETCEISLCDTISAIPAAPFTSPVTSLQDYNTGFYSFELPEADGFLIDLVNPTGVELLLTTYGVNREITTINDEIGVNGLRGIAPQSTTGKYYISISTQNQIDFNHETPYYFTVGCNQVSSNVNEIMHSNDLFKLNGNITKSLLSLEFTSEPITSMSIISSTGQIIWTKDRYGEYLDSESLDISHFPSGVYFVTCTTANSYQTLPFTKL